MVDFLLHNKNLITTVLWLFSDESLNHFIDNLLFPACAFYTIKLRYLPTDSQSLSVHIPNEINEETRGGTDCCSAKRQEQKKDWNSELNQMEWKWDLWAKNHQEHTEVHRNNNAQARQ